VDISFFRSISTAIARGRTLRSSWIVSRLPHRRHDFRWPFLCYIEDRGFRRCGTLLANVFNREIASHSRIGGTSSLGLLIGLFLISFAAAAAAKVYPVSGVWTAIDTDFPAAANETCLAVKTFGVEAVSKKSVSEMIIFAKDKRYDVRGDVQTETTIKFIKMADGGFWITESFSKRGRWFGFKRTTTYFLSVIDPQTIQIRDARGMTRYAKCGPHDRQSKAAGEAPLVNSQFHGNSRN
jgi:hypothetical protein